MQSGTSSRHDSPRGAGPVVSTMATGLLGGSHPSTTIATKPMTTRMAAESTASLLGQQTERRLAPQLFEPLLELPGLDREALVQDERLVALAPEHQRPL